MFGRVLLCRNMEVAAKYAKSHGLTCVTLEGDIVDSKGGIQGGYHDERTSRLVYIAQVYAEKAEVEKALAAKEAADKAVLAGACACDTQCAAVTSASHGATLGVL